MMRPTRAMRPQDVVDVTFRRAPWYRIGLDAADVRAYLNRIAEALVLRDHVERVLRAEIARLRSENERIKAGLNRWQAEQRWHAEQRWRPAQRWHAEQREHAEQRSPGR